MPTVNMWCAQTLMLTKADRDGRGHHDRITEDRLARKYRDDLGDDGKGRDHQNVDLRMSEDPEEVHPEYGGAAGLRVEEVSAQIAIDDQHDLRGGQRARRRAAPGPPSPDSARRTAASCPSVMPGQRMQRIVVENVDRRADAAECRTPGATASSNRCCVRARMSAKSAERRRTIPRRRVARAVQAVAADEAEVQKQAAECGHPETERIQARKRHVARADHQRHADSWRTRTRSAWPRRRSSWCHAS